MLKAQAETLRAALQQIVDRRDLSSDSYYDKYGSSKHMPLQLPITIASAALKATEPGSVVD